VFGCRRSRGEGAIGDRTGSGRYVPDAVHRGDEEDQGPDLARRHFDVGDFGRRRRSGRARHRRPAARASSHQARHRRRLQPAAPNRDRRSGQAIDANHGGAARGHRFRVAARRRHRHHEHHARVGHRTNPRDRSAPGGWRPRTRRDAAVSRRGGDSQPDRWRDWRRPRDGRRADDRRYVPVAHPRLVKCDCAGIRVLGGDRRVLRLLPGAKGRTARSD